MQCKKSDNTPELKKNKSEVRVVTRWWQLR